MVVKLWLFGVYREVYLFHDVTLSYFAKMVESESTLQQERKNATAGAGTYTYPRKLKFYMGSHIDQ